MCGSKSKWQKNVPGIRLRKENLQFGEHFYYLFYIMLKKKKSRYHTIYEKEEPEWSKNLFKKETEKLIWCKHNPFTQLPYKAICKSTSSFPLWIGVNTTAGSDKNIQLVSSPLVPSRADIYNIRFPRSVGQGKRGKGLALFPFCKRKGKLLHGALLQHTWYFKPRLILSTKSYKHISTFQTGNFLFLYRAASYTLIHHIRPEDD